MSLRRGHRSNGGYNNHGDPPPAYDIEMREGGHRERNQRQQHGRNAR